MGFRVAVASDDAIFVNQHFNKARFFYIYDLLDGEIACNGIRESQPPEEEGHDIERLSTLIDLLADCQAVLVSRIGPGADKALARRKIKAFVVPGASIPEALGKLEKAQKILLSGPFGQSIH